MNVMNLNDIKTALMERFPKSVFESDGTGRSGTQWSAVIPASGLRDAAVEFNRAGFFLETITAMDFRDTLEVVYHFNRFEPGCRAAIRILLEEGKNPDTITDIFHGAGWLEREVHDFFGIEFKGSEDLRALLLPEDADYRPLRKNFGKTGVYRKREDIYG